MSGGKDYRCYGPYAKPVEPCARGHSRYYRRQENNDRSEKGPLIHFLSGVLPRAASEFAADFDKGVRTSSVNDFLEILKFRKAVIVRESRFLKFISFMIAR